ncbi:hypothetical protein RRG08_026082 [Elysia crispata]|uniref:Uncharacterized protein n=1 Tax=Elysia crispata TaxID=231223 RepID=A0AAE0YRK7_9GAST|nr:hypothetical protein RRG08_026082 [Elysia crispata]
MADLINFWFRVCQLPAQSWEFIYPCVASTARSPEFPPHKVRNQDRLGLRAWPEEPGDPPGLAGTSVDQPGLHVGKYVRKTTAITTRTQDVSSFTAVGAARLTTSVCKSNQIFIESPKPLYIAAVQDNDRGHVIFSTLLVYQRFDMGRRPSRKNVKWMPPTVGDWAEGKHRDTNYFMYLVLATLPRWNASTGLEVFYHWYYGGNEHTGGKIWDNAGQKYKGGERVVIQGTHGGDERKKVDVHLLVIGQGETITSVAEFQQLSKKLNKSDTRWTPPRDQRHGGDWGEQPKLKMLEFE